jgi:hypothetical protein
MWRGNRGEGAVEGLGSGGTDTGFLARCEGEGDAFFLFSCYWIGRRRMRVGPAEQAPSGAEARGGRRGCGVKARHWVKERRWTSKDHMTANDIAMVAINTAKNASIVLQEDKK